MIYQVITNLLTENYETYNTPMTNAELQTIVSSVLSSLQTNARSISGLTPVTTLSDSDLFEVSGGRCVSYGVLKNLISSMSADDQDSLKTLINKKELKSVELTTTASSATLTISSIGKTISCTIPVATDTKGGLMSALDKTRLDSAYSMAKTANDTTIPAAKESADYAKGQVNALLPRMSNVENRLTDVETQASSAYNGVNSLYASKGQAGGIAPLDANGKVPSANLPGYVDDVIEFNSMVNGVTLPMLSVDKKSTDPGCMVVYDKSRNTFLLAVSQNHLDSDPDVWNNVLRPVRANKLTTPQTDPLTPVGSLIEGDGAVNLGEIWDIDDNGVINGIIVGMFTYYGNWADAQNFGEGTANGRVPESGKVYICTSDNKTFRWSGSELVTIGSDLALGHTPSTAFPGHEGAQLQEDVEELAGEVNDLEVGLNSLQNEVTDEGMRKATFIDLNKLFDNSNPYSSLGEALAYVPNELREYGAVVRLWIEKEDSQGNLVEKWETYQWTKTPFDTDANWENESQWELFGSAGSADGNCLNVTVEIPKTNTTNPYYDLGTAIAAVFSKDRAKLGLQITFASTATTWKQYQYIGSTLDVNDFCNESNWIDMAGTSAGTEPVLNVNDLCGEGALQYGAYTLESAIKAISDKETETGITYRKAGMVITYKIGDGKWESKQLVQTVNSFNVPDAWESFGSAKGSEVKTSDTPVKDGNDAFSTGGAYSAIPRFHDVTQEDGTVSIQFYADEAHQDAIMDPIEFLASQGGGGDASGTIVSIAFQKAPLYAALGSSLTGKATGI